MTALFDIDQLRTFIAIVDSGSFTRASDIVHKTQSAVSMQMKRLEERVGKPIFLRDGRQSRLTEDGERLLDYARRIVKLSFDAVSAFSSESLAGTVRFGLPDDYAERYLPEILARFSRTNPKVEITITCEPTFRLIAAMDDGGLDLALITHTARKPLGEVIRQEPLYWVTAERGTAHHERVLPLAVGNSTCAWREAAVERLEASDRPYRMLFSSCNFSAIGAAVLAGLAVSVLPESALRPGMRVLSAADGFPTLPACHVALLRYGQDNAPAIDALAAQIVASLHNLHDHPAPSVAAE